MDKPAWKKKKFKSPQVFFDLMWHVIGPLSRQLQPLRSAVWYGSSVVYCMKLGVECAENTKLYCLNLQTGPFGAMWNAVLDSIMRPNTKPVTSPQVFLCGPQWYAGSLSWPSVVKTFRTSAEKYWIKTLPLSFSCCHICSSAFMSNTKETERRHSSGTLKKSKEMRCVQTCWQTNHTCVHTHHRARCY